MLATATEPLASVRVCPMCSVPSVTNVNATTGNWPVDLVARLVVVILLVLCRPSATRYVLVETPVLLVNFELKLYNADSFAKYLSIQCGQ